MKFRYSKFRHSASEPKEKRNELSLRSEIVGKTRRARSNGLCSASRRATWCSESRERSALDNLRHVYVHFAKPRPEKKKVKTMANRRARRAVAIPKIGEAVRK